MTAIRATVSRGSSVLGATGLAVAGALVTAGAVREVGPVGLAVPLALLVLLVPLSNPKVALGLLVGAAILFESSSPNILHFTTEQFQDPLPGHYSLLELLMVLAVCSTLIDATRRRSVPLRPAPFGPVLALLTFALVAGSLVGHYAGEGFNAITEEVRPFLPMIVVPWLTVNAIRDRTDLRRAIGLLAIMCLVKSLLGLAGVAAHVGVTVGSTTITYYESTANWLAMTFLLAMLASWAGGVPVGRLARWAVPIVLLALVLSLRRSFWIATAAAAPVALVIASAPARRRFLVPAALVVAAAVWLATSTGIAIDSQSAVGKRLQSLNPSSLSSNAEDRYRLDERKNVLAEIRAHPVVGIGLAVPWQIRYPLSTSDTAQTYVHMAVLFYWLKLGLAGVIAYLGYLLTGFVVGIQVYRRHPDPRIRVAGAGIAAGLVGLGVAETTATFLGSELRTTTLIGFVAGLLSVAYLELRDANSMPLPPAASYRE